MTLKALDDEAAAERLAVGFNRLVTRRRLLRNAMRGGLVVGGALSAPLALFQGRAQAAGCSYYGRVSTWGCYCAPTPSCSASRCTSVGGCSSPARKRCDYWRQPEASGNYCWCSLTCTFGALYGYYNCCDCWTGGSGSCSQSGGASRCVCKDFHCYRGC